MTTTTGNAGRSIQSLVSPQEWQVRVDLAACYRLVVHYGMTDLIYNHITARVPDRSDEFLINPFGLLYEEITASSLHKLNLHGEIVLHGNTSYDLNQTGFVIHGAIHEGRPDVGCVIHTHSRASMAVSTMKEGLLPLSQHAMRFYEKVAYHDYEGLALDLEEQKRLVADLGEHQVMFLRNHGLVVCAKTIPEAFNVLYFVEMACKVQVDAVRSGVELIVPPEDVRRLTAHQYDPEYRRPYGFLEWEAMLRLLERNGSTHSQ